MNPPAFIRTQEGGYLNLNTIQELWVCPPPEDETTWAVVATFATKDKEDDSDMQVIGYFCCEGHARLYLDDLMGYSGDEETDDEPSNGPTPTAIPFN